jgi:hypothetical protein
MDQTVSAEIEDLRHEVISKGKSSSYDALFKVIIIGDSGTSLYPNQLLQAVVNHV